MKVKIHPVIIPDTLDIARNLRTDLRHTDGQNLVSLDLSQYDYKTVFYDIFFNPGNTILYGIGPALLNLKKALPITSVNINGTTFSFKLSEINPKTTILRVDLPASLELVNENLVTIQFGDKWTWHNSIPKNTVTNTSVVTLTTLQKDNKIRWISDWINYYKDEHGVETIILYDNNSEYQPDLEEKLDLEDVNLYVIDWNFLYGPSKSHGNQFCQLGSLNHCRLKFGGAGYCLNFDIDELLVVKSGNLLDLLTYDQDVVYFDSYMVHPTGTLNEEYSFISFPFREKISRIQDGSHKATKYLYRFAGVYANSVHFAITLRQRRWKLIEKGLKFLKLDKFFADKIEERSVVPPHKAYYLHYSAITNGWKSSSRLKTKERDDLVEDLSAIEAFSRNLKPSSH